MRRSAEGRSRQATRITPPGSGSACRTALPTSSASTATGRRAASGVRRPASSAASRCRASRAPPGVVGDHHAPGSIRSLPLATVASTSRHRLVNRVAAAPLRPYRRRSSDVGIPIHSAVQRSGGRDRGRARPPGSRAGRRTRPARTGRTPAPRAPGRMPMPRSLTRNATVDRRAEAVISIGRVRCRVLAGVGRQLGQHGGQAGPVAERLGQVAREAEHQPAAQLRRQVDDRGAQRLAEVERGGRVVARPRLGGRA